MAIHGLYLYYFPCSELTLDICLNIIFCAIVRISISQIQPLSVLTGDFTFVEQWDHGRVFGHLVQKAISLICSHFLEVSYGDVLVVHTIFRIFHNGT